MMLPLAPAHAGSWTFSCTGSGSSTVTTTSSSGGPHTTIATWIPPNPSTGSSYQVYGLSGPTDHDGYTSITDGDTWADKINIQATVTLTWAPTAGQTAATDPAPPSVMLIESSSASWTAQVYNSQAVYSAGAGNADDGIGDPEIDHSYHGAVQGGDSSSANNTKIQVPPVHYTSYPVPGGVLTLPKRTFIANAGYACPTGGGAADFACSVGTYSIQIHAQPYGWYDVGWSEPNGTHHSGPVIDNTNGTLTFEYGWRSTDGNLSSLSGITMYEYLSYSGPGTFSADSKIFYPGPPVTKGYNIPNGRAGSNIDPTHLYAVDAQSPFSVTAPLSAQTWTAAQNYEFDDPATGEVGTVLYDAGNITDSVQLSPNQFYVSKSGYSATKPL